AAGARALHAGRPPLPHRCEHPPRAGARSRLGLPRREGPDAAVAAAARARQSARRRPVKLSLSQISTANATLAEDLAAYRAAGFEGIGLSELKLTADDAADLDAVRASGLEVTNCVPELPTILPNPVMPGPDDPDQRIASIC